MSCPIPAPFFREWWGGIAIILAFFAFQTLPVNYAGVLLILLALIFFVMEMKITSFGMLSIAGVTSLVLGSIMLFEENGTGVRLSWQVLISTVIPVSLFFIVVAGLVFRAQVSRPKTGASGMVGEIGGGQKAPCPRRTRSGPRRALAGRSRAARTRRHPGAGTPGRRIAAAGRTGTGGWKIGNRK